MCQPCLEIAATPANLSDEVKNVHKSTCICAEVVKRHYVQGFDGGASKRCSVTAQGYLSSAFTLVEVLVVVSVLALLAALVLPSMGKSMTRVKQTACLSNHKTLAQVWQMYAADNRDFIPPTGDGLGTTNVWIAGNMADPEERRDFVVLSDESQSLIAHYVKTPSVFKCPADRSGNIRSYSVNYRMNPVRTVGPVRWIAGKHSEYLTFRKVDELSAPALRFVTLDERADSINDAFYVVDSSNTGDPDGAGTERPCYMIDFPGAYHAGNGLLSFADGHVQSHKWVERTTTPAKPSIPRSWTSDSDRDVKWLQAVSTERRGLPIE